MQIYVKEGVGDTIKESFMVMWILLVNLGRYSSMFLIDKGENQHENPPKIKISLLNRCVPIGDLN